ncbi:MAG: hypothetical protein IT305_27085 [Chloroflexi bacterium]|nr:hypothetical protein [Chloroflexota bacterium]
MMRSPRRRQSALRLFGLLAVAFLLAQPLLLLRVAAPAAAQGIDPRDLALTDDEAGKQATRSLDQEGSDGRSTYVRLQWERNQEGPDALTGPWTVHSSVWVAQDFESARAIFKEQSDKNKAFPEAFYARGGTFAFPLTGIGNQSAGLSACFDCNAKDEIFLHHRAVIRWGIVVHVLYFYGPDKVVPQGLASWYIQQIQGRIPEAALTAPERVGGPPTTERVAGPSDLQLVTANPKEITLRIDEVGKRAEVQRQKEGKDARGNWHEVRYERGGTGSRFFEGPVTIYSYVFVAKDVESAKQVYQEQAKLNEKFPEADKRVGDRFELKGGDGVGDESQGLSACERACNLDGDIYVHKRLVFRTYNAVSVVYLYGLSVDEGNTDWHAVNFSQIVNKRFTGE